MSSNDLTGYPSEYEYHRRQVADLEQRYREAVDLLRDVRSDWPRISAGTHVAVVRLLTGEERDMNLHEGPMKTGGNKPRTGTPRPASDPGAQRANLAEARLLLSDDSPYISHSEWSRRRDDLLTAIDALQGDPRD